MVLGINIESTIKVCAQIAQTNQGDSSASSPKSDSEGTSPDDISDKSLNFGEHLDHPTAFHNPPGK